MKLPNFLYFDELNNLRKIINAPLDGSFSVQSKYTPLAIKLLEWWEIEGLKLDDITISPEWFLEIEWQKVVVYIRDQHTNLDYVPETSSYKYHFSFCQQLKSFEAQWKSDKYVATKTAKFRIEFKRFWKHIGSAEYDLNVCKYCLRNSDYHWYIKSPKIKQDEIYNNFSREKYFAEYDSEVVNYSKYSEKTAPANEYPSDWSEISRQIRNERWNKCEKCGSDKNLEVDHINELKYDVSPENLQVLCHYCHSKKHSHMSKFKKY